MPADPGSALEIHGGNGRDELYGGDGNDELHGGNGRDALHGGGGDDGLWGDNGDDALWGGAGRDWLWGGRGADRLTGGPGDDTFVVRSRSDGTDTVTDWGEGRDRIALGELLDSTRRGPADVILDEAAVPGATVIRIAGTGVSIIVLDARAEDFDLSALAEDGVIWSRAQEGPVVLAEVPAYDWYHGCSPTAIASVFAYWDLTQYAGFFDAEGWDELRLTSNVQDQISSPAHNAKYDPTPDDPDLPDPPDTSIADFLGTSVDPLAFGYTWISSMEAGIEGFAAFRGHPLDAWTWWIGAVAWEDVTGEIDEARPMVFHVDTDGNGGVDHSIPVLGYDDRDAEGRWYGAYTTWSEEETVSWFEFRPAEFGAPWGVSYVTFIAEFPGDAGPSEGRASLVEVDHAINADAAAPTDPWLAATPAEADRAWGWIV
jgi:hypothetical protein